MLRGEIHLLLVEHHLVVLVVAHLAILRIPMRVSTPAMIGVWMPVLMAVLRVVMRRLPLVERAPRLLLLTCMAGLRFFTDDSF